MNAFQPDMNKLYQLAHLIAGASGSAGAIRIKKISDKMQKLAKSEDISTFRE